MFRQGSEELSSKVIDRAQVKISKLSRFFREQNYEALAYVDVERESGSQNSEKLWRTSINLDLAGDRFNATGTGNSPDKAVDLAIKDLKREVRRAGAKESTLRKRGGSILKRLRQGFA